MKNKKNVFNIKPLDDEEKQIMEDYENDQYVPVSDQEGAKIQAQEAARNYLNKDAKINIRISSIDTRKIKAKAAAAGIPYQTLIGAILHQFANDKIEVQI